MGKGGSIGVPAEHQVIVYSASALPGVEHSRGGVVLVNFGCVGDDADRELDEISSELDRSSKRTEPTLIASAERVEDLFAPAQPAVTRIASVVVWLFHRGGATSLGAEPHRLQRVIARMRAVEAGAVQAAYVMDRGSAALRAFADAVRQVGVEVRAPDERDGTPAVMIEVERPDRKVLSALVGTARAEATIDGPPEPLLSLRSPLLDRLILDLNTGKATGTGAIVTALRARALPLLLIVDRATRSMMVRGYGDFGPAVSAFADLPRLERAASELKIAPGSYAVAALGVRELFEMTRAQNIGVAIGSHREATPVYALLRSLDG